MSSDIDLDTFEAALRKILDQIWKLKKRQWRDLQDDPVGADLFSAIKKLGTFSNTPLAVGP
jgi:hypothetical protein